MTKLESYLDGWRDGASRQLKDTDRRKHDSEYAKGFKEGEAELERVERSAWERYPKER